MESSTEILRRMLDERGVEWETDRSGFRVMWGKPVDEFHDTMQFKAVDNALPNGGLNVHICGFTPAQAIAATLGRGECHMELTELRGPAYTDVYQCSECGEEVMVGTVMGESEPPKWCPWCGRKVVDDGHWLTGEEIVRCGDCRYFDEIIHACDHPCVTPLRSGCPENWIFTCFDNDFCCWGKRKEVDA